MGWGKYGQVTPLSGRTRPPAERGARSGGGPKCGSGFFGFGGGRFGARGLLTGAGAAAQVFFRTGRGWLGVRDKNQKQKTGPRWAGPGPWAEAEGRGFASREAQ
jgi:hypothetical protein